MASYILHPQQTATRGGYTSAPIVGGTNVIYAQQPMYSTPGAAVQYEYSSAPMLDGSSGAVVLAPEHVTVERYAAPIVAPAGYGTGAVVPYSAPSMQSYVTRKHEVVQSSGEVQPALAGNQLVVIPNAEDAALRSISRFHHPVPHLVGAAPNIYGTGVDPRRKLLQTDMGDIVLLGDSENVLRHVTMALAPVLEQVNTLRYRQGMHPIGIERKFVGRNRQQLVFDKNNHIAIFCCGGGNIRTLNSTLDKTDHKGIYMQVHNGKNEILMFIVGDVQLPIASGLLTPNPNHQELYDPILRDSGVFQNCPTTMRKLKTGEIFSFQTNLNVLQQRQLYKIILHVQKRCHTLDKQKDFFS